MLRPRANLFLPLFVLLTITACSAFSFNQPGPTPAPLIETPYGPMSVYRTPTGRFEVLTPAEWNDAAGDDRRCRDAQKCLISRNSEFMLLREVRMPTDGGTPLPLPAAIDNVIANFEATTADATFLSRRTLDLPSGLPAEELRYTIENGTVSVKELWAADDDLAISIAFITWNEGFPALEPVAEYINRSLTASVPAE